MPLPFQASSYASFQPPHFAVGANTRTLMNYPKRVKEIKMVRIKEFKTIIKSNNFNRGRELIFNQGKTVLDQNNSITFISHQIDLSHSRIVINNDKEKSETIIGTLSIWTIYIHVYKLKRRYSFLHTSRKRE